MTKNKRVQELLEECQAISDDPGVPTERAQLRVRVRLAEIQSLLKAPASLTELTGEFDAWARVGAANEEQEEDTAESRISEGNALIRRGFR
jgi:hypothetical protein